MGVIHPSSTTSGAAVPLSVIICSHNPRPDYLSRCLAALERQSLPRGEWELLLVDNASSAPLRDRFSIAWHDRGRQCHEATVGLNATRMHGVRESVGDLIVFVDDDNVLEPDYLETCVDFASRRPDLGAFGGSTVGTYDAPPPSWFVPWKMYVGDRTVSAEAAAFAPSEPCAPIGAGMCVRRSVARLWLDGEMSRKGPTLDRVGKGLVGSGDIDLAYHALLLGMGYGVTPRLKLAHLIPERRTQFTYMRRLVYGTGIGFALCEAKWGRPFPPREPPSLRRLAMTLRFGAASILKPDIQRSLRHWSDQGIRKGWAIARRAGLTGPKPAG